MAAKFEIRSPKEGQYIWVLVSQGRTLATSEAYARRAQAEKAIVSFQMAAVNAPVIDTTVPPAKTPAGQGGPRDRTGGGQGGGEGRPRR